jgi:hypothetical protein
MERFSHPAPPNCTGGPAVRVYQDVSRVALLALVTFAIVMCYGGGYGITPGFAADYFGPQNVGPIFRAHASALGIRGGVWSSTVRVSAPNHG